jgi:spore germination protein KB
MVPAVLISPTLFLVKDLSVGWINDFLGTLVALPVIVLLVKLGQKYPDKTIVEYSELLLGPIAGKIIGLMIVISLFLTTCGVARVFGEVLTNSLMIDTPILVLVILVISICANGARIGLEIPARFSEIFTLLTIILMTLVSVLPYQYINFENLQPLYLTHGLSELIAPVGSVASFYMEFLILGMLIPYLNRPREALRYTLGSLSICLAILVMECVVLIAVFGPIANSFTLPAFELARVISLGEFIEHVEGLIVTVWEVAVGVKLTLFLWVTSLGLAQVLGLKNYHPVVYPLSALVIPVSLILWNSLIDLEAFLLRPWIVLTLTWIPFLVALLYCARALRAKSSGKGADHEPA